MHISRIMSDVVAKKLHSGKAIVLIGARQVGKTTLLKECLKGQENVLWMSGDNLRAQEQIADGQFSGCTAYHYGQLVV